ncbi:T9SS type A sorting domain-containing protein [Draconibacterium sp. IB214405]|uniref:T9SS type A sorting domain-containing protein n=1 Tax=Draconibacterium sp. IB214405 TaxID=3097352 RepID=UPI002A170CA7|nr:T9SS type A sorting domain-containing protein [Draconibacterium sp. IB214405]MDX8338507.1 T9SS type A sorting domain-containing protein [Draconibacterium sp. IB214405]
MKKLILTVTVLLPLFSVFAQTKSNVTFDPSQNFQSLNIEEEGNPEIQFISDYVVPEELELIQDSIVYESFDTTTFEWVRMKRYNQIYEEDGNCGSVWIKIWNDSTQVWKDFKISEQCWNEDGEEIYNERKYYSSLNLMEDTVIFYGKTVEQVEFHDDQRTVKTTSYNDPLRNGEMVQTNQEEYTYDTSDNQVFYMHMLWSEERAVWDTIETQENAYDEYGNKVKDRVMHWGGTWDLSLRGEHYLEWHYNVQNKLDTLYWYWWNYDIEEWVISGEEISEYNEDTLLVRRYGLYWDMEQEALVNSSSTEWDYDTMGNEILKMEYRWNSDSYEWKNEFKIETLYTESGKKQMETSYSWNDDSLKWIGSRKLEYEYTDGRLYDYKVLWWEEELNDWVQSEHKAYEYEYDNENRLVLKITKRANSVDSLINYEKNENIYEPLKKISISYLWQSNEEKWLPQSKGELEYNNEGVIILQRNFNWDNLQSEWILQLQWEYEYDVNGNLIMNGNLTNFGVNIYWGNKTYSIYDGNNDPIYNANYTWDDEINDWKGVYKREQSWVQKHRMDTSTNYLWNEVAWNWIPTSRHIYYYSEIETDVEVIKDDIGFRVYPNPASQNVTFDIDSNVTECRMELYDMNGKLRLSKDLLQGKTISVNHLTSGLYFWRVVQSDQIYNGKLIIN